MLQVLQKSQQSQLHSGQGHLDKCDLNLNIELASLMCDGNIFGLDTCSGFSLA